MHMLEHFQAVLREVRAPSVRSAQRKSWCLPFSRCSKPTTAADLSPSCAISTASQHPTGSVFPSQTTVQRAETRGGDVVSPGCLISSPCPSSCRFPRGGGGGGRRVWGNPNPTEPPCCLWLQPCLTTAEGALPTELPDVGWLGSSSRFLP